MSFLKFCRIFLLGKNPQHGALMLDACFKGMDCIMDYIGRDQATILVQQYDDLIVMPLLKYVMGFLNLDQIVGSIFPSLKLPSTSTRLFGLPTSTQEGTKNLFKAELYIFFRFNVENIDGLDPLIWWFVNVFRFPNIGFLA